MQNRCKIYLRNKKGKKKGVLIMKRKSGISAAELDAFRKAIKQVNNSSNPLTALVLPHDATWQYIQL